VILINTIFIHAWLPHRKENATDFHFTVNHANCNNEILAIIPFPATKHMSQPYNRGA
jgi:hypothetical protein